MHFDIFTIRQWKDCYTLQVKIARPANAPRYKYTKADRKRMLAANAKNMELLERTFATLEDVIEEIKGLQFPSELSSVAHEQEEEARATLEPEPPIIGANLPMPEFGSINITVEGMKFTQSCPDCGTIFMQFIAPPGTSLPSLAHPYITCCGKLRRIGT